MNQQDSNSAQKIAADFVEKMGLSAEADGLPRIAGRMWGFLLLHEGNFSFAELAERLQVSRGSISTNARLLRDLGIIERVALPGDRQDYYRIADNPFYQMMQGYVERMKRIQKDAEQTLNSLPESWKGAHHQLRQMKDFYEQAVYSTESLIQRMRSQATADKETQK